MNSAEREFAFQLLLSESLALLSSLLFYRLHKKVNRGWARGSKLMISTKNMAVLLAITLYRVYGTTGELSSFQGCESAFARFWARISLDFRDACS